MRPTRTSGSPAVVAHPSDNVATAVKDLAKDQEVVVSSGSTTETVVLLQDIPFGHKLALRDLSPGDEVRKYGEAIGRATRQIRRGEHVHVHNVESARGRGDLEATER